MSAVHLAVLVFRVAAAGDIDDSMLDELLDVEPPARQAVLQNRQNDLAHELSLLFGGMPADPFVKGITASLGYTLHLSESWAWEILQATYAYALATKLQREVLRYRDATFPAMRYLVASHLVFKPIYAKEALFNTDVVHLEAYLQAGPAALLRSDAPQLPRFGADLGFGLRLWLTPVVSLRFDVGELLYVADGIEQALHLHCGLAFNFQGEE